MLLYGLSTELVHSEKLHPREKAEYINLLGHLEQLANVVFGERVKNNAIDQVSRECLCEVGETAVCSPFKGNPAVVDIGGQRVLIAAMGELGGGGGGGRWEGGEETREREREGERERQRERDEISFNASIFL